MFNFVRCFSLLPSSSTGLSVPSNIDLIECLFRKPFHFGHHSFTSISSFHSKVRSCSRMCVRANRIYLNTETTPFLFQCVRCIYPIRILSFKLYLKIFSSVTFFPKSFNYLKYFITCIMPPGFISR